LYHTTAREPFSSGTVSRQRNGLFLKPRNFITMKTMKCTGVILAVFLLSAAVDAIDLRILVPLYSYPNWYDSASYRWPTVARAGAMVPITAIIDPANGPGANFPNSDYAHGMADLAAGGVTMVGYVYTSYGARSASLVKSDIDQYTNSPLVTGIFVDETASETNKLAYYRDLYTYIHSRTNFTTVIVNPGIHVAQEYLSRPAADTAVIFEDGTGWTNYVPDAYVTNYTANLFSMLVYACANAETMRTNVDLAVQRNMGWVYVTDDILPNPWDTVPAYWSNLVEYVEAYRNLRVSGIAATTSGVTLTFSAISNRPARVEWTPTLPATDWTPVNGTPSLLPTGTILQVTDTNRPSGSCFYRLRILQS
jgi:hypothetical protein